MIQQSGLTQVGGIFAGPGSKTSLTALLGASPLPKLTYVQKDAVKRAKKYATEESIKAVLVHQAAAHQEHQTRSYHRQQAFILMCKIYVGSINFTLKEEDLRQAFSAFGPIKGINMSWDPTIKRHKGFAFVEYETPEAAQLAVEEMNGATLGGRMIKVVGKPNTMPDAQYYIDEIMEEASKYNRIYVTSIHKEIKEDDLRSVFEAFGKVKSCTMEVAWPHAGHKGCAYIEYETYEAVEGAVACNNAFDLGGMYLKVGRAITPPVLQIAHSPNRQLPAASAIALAAAAAKIQAIDALVTPTSMPITITTPQCFLPM